MSEQELAQMLFNRLSTDRTTLVCISAKLIRLLKCGIAVNEDKIKELDKQYIVMLCNGELEEERLNPMFMHELDGLLKLLAMHVARVETSG